MNDWLIEVCIKRVNHGRDAAAMRQEHIPTTPAESAHMEGQMCLGIVSENYPPPAALFHSWEITLHEVENVIKAT